MLTACYLLSAVLVVLKLLGKVQASWPVVLSFGLIAFTFEVLALLALAVGLVAIS